MKSKNAVRLFVLLTSIILIFVWFVSLVGTEFNGKLDFINKTNNKFIDYAVVSIIHEDTGDDVPGSMNEYDAEIYSLSHPGQEFSFLGMLQTIVWLILVLAVLASKEQKVEFKFTVILLIWNSILITGLLIVSNGWILDVSRYYR